MKRVHLLFLIIFLEGYVVLAMELLAIRLLIPFVGSGTENISIIISAVLLPLAFGYYWGGHYVERRRKAAITKPEKKRQYSIRNVLINNLAICLIILTFGLSYLVHEAYFALLFNLGVQNIVLQTTFYALTFLVYPTFLFAQTVPLVSNYFAKHQLSQITGKMLYFSTTGSFFGSVFTTIVLMMTIGVHNTVILVLAAVTLMIFLLDKRIFSFRNIVVLIIFGLGFYMNSSSTMKAFKTVSNNAYNFIQVFDDKDGTKVFSANRSISSMYSRDKEKMVPYIKYIERNYINAIKGQNKKILVIGAGAFTVGLDDETNEYTFIDIDPDIKKVAEKSFLPNPLGQNKKFVAQSARAYLAQTDEKFDFIMVDAYTNTISIPMECTTHEFFLIVKQHLKPKGIVVANIIARPDLSDPFSLRIYNTFSSVFPQFTVQTISDFNPWQSVDASADPKAEKKPLYRNMLYAYYDRSDAEDLTVYSDDKNTYSLDKKLYAP